MAKKKTESVPRHKEIAPNRHEPVAPRWKPTWQNEEFAVFERADFVDKKTGGWDNSALYDVRQEHIDKKIVFFEADKLKFHFEKKTFVGKNADGAEEIKWDKLNALKKLSKDGRTINMKQVGFYDTPVSDPRKREVIPDLPAPKRLDKIEATDKVRIVKIVHTAEEKKRINRELAEGYHGVDQPAPAEPKKNRWEKAEETRARKIKAKRVKQKIKREPRESSRNKHGAPYDPTKPLSRNQYVSRFSGRVYYASKSRLAAIKQRERKAAQSELMAMRKEATNAMQTIGNREKIRRAIEAKREVSRLKSVAKRQRRNAVRKSARAVKANFLSEKFVKTVRGLSNYGKAPLGFVLQKARLTGRQPGRARGIKTFSHAEKYPAMRHGSANPLKAPVSMKPVEGILPLAAPRLPSRVAGTSLFTTEKTLPTEKSSTYGQGVMFHINAEEVLGNLTSGFPAALKQAAISAADRVGRKLLDIVEPYVPKDTGLLYSTAKTNTDQVAGGMVDLDGGGEYPAGEMFGVSVSYNTPYAEEVYFNEEKRHGKAYNEHYGTSEKDDRETARWIEVAFEKERGAVQGLLAEYAAEITSSLNSVGGKSVGFRTASGKSVNFVSFGK